MPRPSPQTLSCRPSHPSGHSADRPMVGDAVSWLHGPKDGGQSRGLSQVVSPVRALW